MSIDERSFRRLVSRMRDLIVEYDIVDDLMVNYEEDKYYDVVVQFIEDGKYPRVIRRKR